MNKHRAHHYYRHTKHWRWQYLLAAAGVAAIVCVLALRHNSQQMAIKREAVFAADRDNRDVQAALKELQSYVTAHMNTGLTTGNNGVYPPIQLQYTYQRLVEQQGSQQQSSNSDLYTQAQAYCQSQNSTDFSGRNRVPCIQQYVQSRGAQISLAKNVPDSLYKFDFVSPVWSPDLAGWSLLATLVLATAAAVKYSVDRWFKRHA